MADATRFEGNGNCWLEGRPRRRGWEINCAQCETKQRIVAASVKGTLVPADETVRRFGRAGWKLGRTYNEDLCATCSQRLRTQAAEENARHEDNVERLDYLHGLIYSLDRWMNANVTLQSSIEFQNQQLDLVKQMESLFETARCFELLPWHDKPASQPAPEPVPPPTLESVWAQAGPQEREIFRNNHSLIYQHLAARATTLEAVWEETSEERQREFLALSFVLMPLRKLIGEVNSENAKLKAELEELRKLPPPPPKPTPSPPQERKPVATSSSNKMAELVENMRKQLH